MKKAIFSSQGRYTPLKTYLTAAPDDSVRLARFVHFKPTLCPNPGEETGSNLV
jgi:hypothetical protein